MSKKILSVLLAVMMLFAVLTGCASGCDEKPEKKPSSSTDSVIESVPSEDVSSGIASVEEEESSSSHPYKWQIQTTSATFRDDPAAKVSATVSTTIKQYKNPDSVQLGCYHLSLRWCDTYGEDLDSRIREFTEIVEQKYFNTYLLDATNSEYLLLEVPIIAESGATFWLFFGNYNSTNETIEAYTERVRLVIDTLKAKGFGDLINGVMWDEPIWNGQTNEDFLKQSEVHYKVFGLRNNPVLAMGEFSDSHGNADGSDNSKKISRAACKYITDIGYDSYSIDVRDGVVFPQDKLNQWSGAIGKPVTDGKSYYVAHKEYLKEYVGHDVNWWYFPCAYAYPTVQGGVADEAFCMAHLNFMVEDLLKDEFPGGVVVYTYYTHSTHKRTGLNQYIPFKDEFGNYTHYPETEKWHDYFKLLQDTCEKLNSKKANLVDLGL